MKKFKVTNEMYKNGNVVEASRDNYAGDYVTAESEAEAIELYKDFLIEVSVPYRGYSFFNPTL